MLAQGFDEEKYCTGNNFDFLSEWEIITTFITWKVS